MHHAQLEILQGLDPINPASIQSLIDFHRTAFGGFVMAETDPTDGATATGTDGQDGQDTADQNGGGDNAADLGEGGKKALQRERDARKQLETELRDFKAGQSDQAKRLAAALGIETKDAKSSDDITAQLGKEVAEMRHQLLVDRVARAHKITDGDDLELIRGSATEESMRKLAARLAGAAKDGADGADAGKSGDGKKRSPKPDPSQGQGSSSGNRATSVEQVRADLRAAREAKK